MPGIIEHPEPTLTADVRIIRTDHAEGDHGIRIEGFPDGARHLGRMRENGKNLLWLVSCSLQGGVFLKQLHQGLDYRLYDSSFPDRERVPVDVDGGGKHFWQIEYDLLKDECMNFYVHGEA